MRVRHIAVLTFVFAWQSAPLDLVQDEETGRIHLSLGAGVYGVASETWTFGGCDGPAFKKDHVEAVASAGGVVDVRATRNIRMMASGGRFHRNLFGSFLLAWEGRLAGIGAGWASGHSAVNRAGDSAVAFDAVRIGWNQPTAYLRIGQARERHFRADALMPSTTFGLTGWLRAGVAMGDQRQDVPRAFLGLSAVQTDARTSDGVRDVTAAFIDLNVPIWERGMFQLRGQVGVTPRAGAGIGAGIRSAW